MIALLVIVGFLGGRGWSGRVVWAGGLLLVSSGIIFAIFGPGYDKLAKSGPIYDAVGVSDLDELREDALIEIADGSGAYPETSRLVANKVFDVIESVSDRFTGGIARSSLTLVIIGLIAVVAAIFWEVIVSTVRGLLPNRGR